MQPNFTTPATLATVTSDPNDAPQITDQPDDNRSGRSCGPAAASAGSRGCTAAARGWKNYEVSASESWKRPHHDFDRAGRDALVYRVGRKSDRPYGPPHGSNRRPGCWDV